eukprot:gene45240-57610_t
MLRTMRGSKSRRGENLSASLGSHRTGSVPERRGEKSMHAMVLEKLHAPLRWTELPDRLPGPGQIRVKVTACGVCRTDLHVVD